MDSSEEPHYEEPNYDDLGDEERVNIYTYIHIYIYTYIHIYIYTYIEDLILRITIKTTYGSQL